jgi:hypothetical protein
MNLLHRTIENRPNILDFREYQYNLIPEMLKMSFLYLQRLGFEFDPKFYKEEIIEDISYHGLNHFATRIHKIKIHENTKDWFLHLSLPILIESQFFKLNGALYVPGYWITDSPITVKQKSVLCYGLFNSLTFYSEESRAIFLGNNIPICRFLRLFLNEDEIKWITSENYLDCKYVWEDYNYSMTKLGELVGGIQDPALIKEKFNHIFFDSWTEGLYKEFYNVKEINFDVLIDLLVISLREKENKSFIDLQYKRLVFVEYLMIPFLKAVSSASKYILNGQKPYKLSVNIGDIIKFFFTKMDKFNFYGVVNGFGGSLLDLKATFKNPNSTGNLPSEVSSIHPRYKDKIDLVSISNTEPGKVVSLVPEQNLRSLRYGIFDFDK